MIALIVSAHLLLSPLPQEKPKTQEPPPDAQLQRLLQEGQSVTEEKTIDSASGARKTDTAAKGTGNASEPKPQSDGKGGAAHGEAAPSDQGGQGAGAAPKPQAPAAPTKPAKGAAATPAKTPAAQSAKTPAAPPAASAGTKPTDHDRRVSNMFVANALYQQELANRRQVISVEEVTTPEAALAEMEAGNDRFVKGMRARTLMTAQDPDVRAALTKGQSPFAVVVTCSDSRAADNLIFDQELGRIFTIRLAGNSPDTAGIASIEYAVEHCGSKVVIIMGHTKCGAIGAVADAKGEPLPDNLYIFQQLMTGLLETTPKDQNETVAEYKDRLEQVNASRQAQQVYNRSRVVRELVGKGKIWLLPASYDLATGKVTFMNLVEGAAEEDHSGHHH